MHFQAKNTLKNNNNHTLKHLFKFLFFFKFRMVILTNNINGETKTTT